LYFFLTRVRQRYWQKTTEFNAGTPIGIGGPPSVGNGMLFVTTGQTFTIGNACGGIIAFGLPPPPPQTKWGGLQTII
jgi:hypothetical protein